MSHINKNYKVQYKRTITRSNTIASTLFVLFATAAIVLIVNCWDTISPILQSLGLIG